MKMSKYIKMNIKKIILLLIIVSIIPTLFINVKAKNDNNNESKDYSKCTNSIVTKDINPSYEYVLNGKTAKATLTVAKGKLLIRKIDEGVYDEDTDKYTPNASVTHVDNPNQYLNKVVTADGKNPTIILKQAGSTEQATYIRVTYVLSEAYGNCDSASQYEEKTGQRITDASQTKAREITATAVIELFIPVPKEGSKIYEENTNYGTDYCKLMRANSTEEAVQIANQINSKTAKSDEKVDVGFIDKYFNPSRDYKEKYEKYLSQCYNANSVLVNYTNSKLASLISSVVKATDSLIKAQPANPSSLFQQTMAISDIKAAAEYQEGEKYDEPGKKNKHTYSFEKMPDKITVTNALKCEYRLTDKIKNINKLNSRDENNQYNYTNNEYYYAISKEKITRSYRYNYDYEDQSQIKYVNKEICEKTCEEGLIVSYGPPQAVAAGFCFEYQIKVISKVKCNVDLYDAAPTLEGYCTPVPQCEHVNIGTLTQAGPGTQFDTCIAACDGGKYTQSCSKSCYNKVYGKKGNINETALTYSGQVKQIANVDSEGKYVRSSEGIKWVNTGGRQTFARWYLEEDKKRYSDKYGVFEPDENGFKRKEYKKGGECDGKCHNSGCDGDVYLNPSTAEEDYNYNMGQYQSGLSECSAGATCSTKTSYYNINVDNYSKYDQAELKGDTQFSNQLNASSDRNILLDGNGCYNNNAQDYYAAEWSFPGTWVNNKTGEISFKNDKINGWHRVTNKFCLPLDAKSTNSNWWNLYMKMAQGKVTSETGTGSYKSTEYNDQCKDISTASSNSVSDWNIHGSTTDFGFFKWNIKISCFYATQAKDTTTTPPECKKATLNGYTTRTVDNQDLFPTTESSGKATTAAKDTGRTPGFNWTKSATISLENGKTNPNYQVDPTVLIEKIQKLKDGVFNDEKSADGEVYLDYDISLSPEQINAIKRDIKAKTLSYENWDNAKGNTKEAIYKNNMILYQSKFLNNSKYVTVNRRGLIGCNNQKDKDACLNLIGN